MVVDADQIVNVEYGVLREFINQAADAERDYDNIAAALMAAEREARRSRRAFYGTVGIVAVLALVVWTWLLMRI